MSRYLRAAEKKREESAAPLMTRRDISRETYNSPKKSASRIKRKTESKTEDRYFASEQTDSETPSDEQPVRLITFNLL